VPLSRFLSRPVLAALLALGSLAPVAARAQCILANPSFELPGTAPTVFQGWNQFGVVASSASAVHGRVAALVSGPNATPPGAFVVSGLWQPMTSTSGDRWIVTGRVRVPSVRGLTGTNKAIVNIEWRTGNGALINYESHDVATAASPRDSSLAFTFTSAAAPTGTFSARLLLGVLQGPTDAQTDAIYDQVTFVKITSPTIDAVQWNDFAGGRSLVFAGRTWRVKGPGVYGPGTNNFSNSTSAVFVDASGRLHLTLNKIGTTRYATELALVDALGYGDYVFTTRGDLDTLDPYAVLGLFLWEYGPCYNAADGWWNPYNEIDVEFSRWGVPSSPIVQFVAQPADYGTNRHRFVANFSANEVTTHAIRWRPDRVDFRSWRGGASAESPSTTIHAWTYTGPHIPRPDQPRVHLNLWEITPNAVATDQEVVLDGFQFRKWPDAILDAPTPQPHAGVSLAVAGRNPTRGATTLRFTLAHEGRAALDVLDVTGARVRRLETGPLAAGDHTIVWEGRDDVGAAVKPGVYFVRLDADGEQGAVRVVVLR